MGRNSRFPLYFSAVSRISALKRGMIHFTCLIIEFSLEVGQRTPVPVYDLSIFGVFRSHRDL